MAALRFMTFNLRRDMVADGSNSWRSRRQAAAEVVRGLNPHVLGTQEGLAHQLEDLDRDLLGYRRVGRSRRHADEFNAIYYDVAELKLEATGDFWLSDEPYRPGSASWGNSLPRMVTWARFTHRASAFSFTCASTHLDHESEPARRRSARALRERIPGAVIMGDFNAGPGSDVHLALLEGWQDTGHGGGEDTFHAFRGEAFTRIDWVLAPKSARVVSHRVVRDRPGGTMPSDHWPVVAELAFT